MFDDSAAGKGLRALLGVVLFLDDGRCAGLVFSSLEWQGCLCLSLLLFLFLGLLHAVTSSWFLHYGCVVVTTRIMVDVDGLTSLHSAPNP